MGVRLLYSEARQGTVGQAVVQWAGTVVQGGASTRTRTRTQYPVPTPPPLYPVATADVPTAGTHLCTRVMAILTVLPE